MHATRSIHPSVRNLIFDLGGVILDLHLDRTHEAFSRMAACPPSEMRSRIESASFFNEYERGGLTDDEFRAALRTFIGSDLPAAGLDNAWNAMLGDIPLHRLQLLETLRPHYRLFLLSNTNQIHLDYFTQTIQRVSGKPSLHSFFDKAYFSHLMKMRKPDVEIFEFVIRENGLNPSETLFLDDNLANLEGARSAGLQTFHVEHPDRVSALFS